MNRFTGIALGTAVLFSGSIALAQSVDGIDTQAIEKRAEQNGKDMAAFVKGVLDRASQPNEEAQKTVDVANGAVATANIGGLKGTGKPGEVDLDEIVNGAKAQFAAADPAKTGQPQFMAFASLSMPEDSLRAMIADVSKAGGVVVFRGFPLDNSHAMVAQLKKVVSQDSGSRIIIDPRLFRAFDVAVAPTYVAVSHRFEPCSALDCKTTPPAFDSISGNVTVHYVLETFADGHGPGAIVAKQGLANLERGS